MVVNWLCNEKRPLWVAISDGRSRTQVLTTVHRVRVVDGFHTALPLSEVGRDRPLDIHRRLAAITEESRRAQ